MIVILLDAARADRFSSYGYHRPTTPELDRLAAGGVVFLNNFAQATYTRASLPSILYSRYFAKLMFPNNERVPLSSPRDLFRELDAEAVSLPAALSRAGFHTVAISAHVWLKPGTEFVAEFDELHDLSVELDHPKLSAYPPASDVVDFTLQWIEDHWREDFFIYLHLMDTHFPHFFEADAARFLAPTEFKRKEVQRFNSHGRPEDRERPLSAIERRYFDALYDGSLLYTDRQVGRILRYLRDRDTLDDTLIAVISDHGEQLLEHPGRFGHGGAWYDPSARVPLLIHYPPKLEPAQVDFYSENVDVMPTILGLLDVGLPPDKSADGVDLSRTLAGRLEPKRYVYSRDGIRSDRHKLLFDGRTREALLAGNDDWLRGELYDLQADPLESNDVWESQPGVVDALMRQYRAKMTPLYRRYTEAVSGATPRTAFAIGTNYFEFDGSGSGEVAPGWERTVHWNLFRLVAAPGAGALRLHFALPNGTYAVSASAKGSAEVRLSTGADAVTISSDSVTSEARIGLATVTDERFRAEVIPTSNDEPLLIRYLGFVPQGVATGEAAAIPDEQLRALGYIE